MTALHSKRGQALLILVVAIGGIGIGLLLPRGGTAPQSAPPPLPATPEAAGRVALTADALRKNQIEVVEVRRQRLARDVEVVGSVGLAANYHAEVGPLIPGRIVSVKAQVGERVQAGQVLAELESSEVGTAQAAYLTARATSLAAQANLRRERELAERKVSSERERELAEAAAITEQAQLAAATQRLRALGLRQVDIKQITEARAGIVPLCSPIDGTIISRSVSLGQAVQPATDAFAVANLSQLWVQLDLFEKDLPYVHADQRAEIRTEVYPGRSFPARVAYVGQVIDEKTRTAPVRVEFDNHEGLLRPGQFVTATLQGDPSRVTSEVLAVPRKAVLTVEGKPLVFVQEGTGFGRRGIELGASGGAMIEVRAGLLGGEKIAVDGGFLLKSELLR
ncbi:MAG TPA: efflux RND transporter periplasmic adaptor subunit [Pseudomonadota bacterium]|nr:efflux RND transporter periplasmic adaptor subunit [Pseudomonadota bacterium]